jgi:hypothetical protein
MFKIDGKELDLTKPETLQGVTIKEGGYIEQVKDGVVTRVQQGIETLEAKVSALEAK